MFFPREAQMKELSTQLMELTYMDCIQKELHGTLIQEQAKGELNIEIPVIWLEPINVKKLEKLGYYECPLYKSSRRAGELSTTGHSTNFVMYFYLKFNEEDQQKNSEHWIRRGTALLTLL